MRAVLLDTNAYAKYLRGDPRVLEALAGAGLVYMSVVVLGELYAGFRQGSMEKENRQTLETFLGKPAVRVLEATRETADYFGLIKSSLKKAGQPLPANDIWIAAHALETGSVLVTYDVHFKVVPGLRAWPELT
jgi:tRNA(fMet)-specific endonuclease VapC